MAIVLDIETEIAPLWLWIDPTRRCNLACRLCYTKTSHADVDLEPAALEAMLARLGALETHRLQRLHLNWRGEPLMNPRFPVLWRMAAEYCQDLCWLEVHSNGTLMTEAAAQAFVHAGGPNQLVYVSIDGGRRDLHDKNRGPGTYDGAMRGLRTLLDVRGDAPYPRIGLYQLDMGLAESEYDPAFLELARQVDVWPRMKPVSPVNAVQIGRGKALQPEPRASGACFWSGNSMSVAPNGDVHVCLLSHSQAGIVGNLLDEPAETVLGRAAAFRRRLQLHGRGSTPHCAGCRKPDGAAEELRMDLVSAGGLAVPANAA